MTDKEIDEAIREQKICRIGFIDEEFPYIAPFQYLYLDGVLYFHFTNYGKKKKILKKNNNVCVSVEKLAPDLKKYLFIAIQGKLKKVEDSSEIELVVKKLVQEAEGKFSESFLSAHGFNKEEGWKSFSPKDRIIYKLDDVVNKIGLKSL